MAGEGERMEKSVEELEKEITCAICHEHYTEPKVLPCMHYYCKDCIHARALRKGINKPFSCPECRTDITLPQGGIASLKPAFFINRMKEVHSKLSRAHGKVEAMCESCSGDKAVAFCRQCTQFICAECVQLHLKLKIFTGHKTVSLEELKEGGAKDMVEEAPLQMCPEHDEQMKIYCFDCNCLICRDCTVKDHNGHDHEFVKKAAPKMKKKLLDQLFPLKEVEMMLSHAIDEIPPTKSEVEFQVDTVTTHIQRSFEEVLQQILAQRKRQLIKEAVAKGAEKLQHLASQEKKLSTSRAAVQRLIDYTEQCIEHSAGDEVMCMHAEIQSQIKREIAEQKCNDLYPVEEADIGVEVSCVEDLKQLCQTKAKLIILATEVVVADGIEPVLVNETSEFNVTARLSDGKEVKRKLPLKCHLKSLADGSITKCRVDRTNKGYRIRYTPTVRGRNEIIVTAPGLEIAGSPFPVFASIDPTQQGKPVRLISTGSIEPIHVAINSAGEVVVTDPHNVAIFNREGKEVTSIKLKEVHETNPFGLAIDGDDIVYVPGRQNGSVIIKLTSKLRLLKRSRKFDAEFRDMSIAGDKLLVCDKKDNSIMVFTKELDFMRRIDVKSANIRSVSCDNFGNFYVCGGKSPIQVFTISGQFLHSFAVEDDEEEDKEDKEELSSSRGICVAGGYVYVTDYATYDLMAYTTDGEYVTSLEKNTDYEFRRPCGMCSDKDAFVIEGTRE